MNEASRIARLFIIVLLSIMAMGLQTRAQTVDAPILFQSNGIHIMDADGSNQKKLYTGEAIAPAWSRDGCKIIFLRAIRKPGGKSVQAGISVMNVDGANDRPVIANSKGPGDDIPQSYLSPDGSRIVFISAEENLMVAKSDGSGAKKVTDGFHAFNPSWSPDGSKILFGSNGPRIRVINADGTNLRDLGGGMDAQWSPDGSKVVFSSHQQGRSDIVVMKSDGTNIKVITGGAGVSLRPSWSPDGSKIAFQSFQDDVILEVINADGKNRIKVADHLPFDLSGDTGAPSWSPDGTRIAFTRMPVSLNELILKGAKAMEALQFDVYTVGANGSNLKRLTTTGTAHHPIWSPAAKCQGS
jgi:Tol biopolymer transport system component